MKKPFKRSKLLSFAKAVVKTTAQSATRAAFPRLYSMGQKVGTNYRRAMREDAPVNSVGGGQVAGIGIGSSGEPGVNKKKKTPVFKRKQLNGVTHR